MHVSESLKFESGATVAKVHESIFKLNAVSVLLCSEALITLSLLTVKGEVV